MSAVNRYRNRHRVLVAAALLVLVVAAVIGLHIWERNHSDFDSESAYATAGLLEHEGVYYRLRDDVETVLIIGVDQFTGEIPEIADSYNNDQCADFLSLMVIDHATRRCSILQINRDTMTDVTVLGIGGRNVGKVREQITLSHTYGTGEHDSCRNTARAVEGLLGNLSVDHYICLTMDAVSIINDMVGGVVLTVPEDLTAIDPSFAAGAQIVLNGEQALAYVRQRSVLEDSSNAARMRRQEQYLEALYEAVLDYMSTDDEFSTGAVSELSEHMRSDYDIGALEKTIDALSEYERGEFFSLEGTYAVGEHMEFTPDATAMKKLLISLLYEKDE